MCACAWLRRSGAAVRELEHTRLQYIFVPLFVLCSQRVKHSCIMTDYSRQNGTSPQRAGTRTTVNSRTQGVCIACTIGQRDRSHGSRNRQHRTARNPSSAQ